MILEAEGSLHEGLAAEETAVLIRNIDTASRIFGPAISVYGPLINAIADELLEEEYLFADHDAFSSACANGTISPKVAGQIYWSEIFQRVQLVSVLTIVRTARWIDSCAREYDAGSLCSWAGSCRTLVECVGDSADALAVAGLSLAEDAASIANQLNGSEQSRAFPELEQALIHFTHAKYYRSKADAPLDHKAKTSSSYVDVAGSIGVPNASEFYGKLCELNHPAEPSMAHLYGHGEQGFRLTLDQEAPALHAFVDDNRLVLDQLLPHALNPAFIALRVVGAFGMSEVPKTLKLLDFSPIKQWGKVVSAMKAAGMNI